MGSTPLPRRGAEPCPSPAVRHTQPSSLVPAQLQFPLLGLGIRSPPSPQCCQPPAQLCGTVGAQHGPHSPRGCCITQVPPHHPKPAPTLSLLLQLLRPGPDFSHMALVGLKQLPQLLLVPPCWGWRAGGLSLLHRDVRGRRGRTPPATGWGCREPAVPVPPGCGLPYLQRWFPGRGVGHAEQDPLTGGEHVPQGSPPRSLRSPLSPCGRREAGKDEETMRLSTIPVLGYPELREANGKERVKKC